jgi:hypothetical protein
MSSSERYDLDSKNLTDPERFDIKEILGPLRLSKTLILYVFRRSNSLMIFPRAKFLVDRAGAGSSSRKSETFPKLHKLKNSALQDMRDSVVRLLKWSRASLAFRQIRQSVILLRKWRLDPL